MYHIEVIRLSIKTVRYLFLSASFYLSYKQKRLAVLHNFSRPTHKLFIERQ